tara:strand:- start:101239 stop:101961 length:723 start_codon:yes stop_codon:yes gene_type:complete
MLNKKLLTAAVTTAVLAGASATQAAEISGNVALTSDYKFRGISQSDESPAIQGGFDVAFDNGIYVGTWGSSVDFDTNGDGFDGSLELDYYAGWASTIGDSDIGIDVGYLYYDYPGDNGDEGDYQEFYGSLSWMDATVGVAFSDDYYGGTDEFWYVYADYGFSLMENVSVGLHVGYNMLEEDGGFLSSDEDAYIDYSVSVTYAFSGVDLSLAYVGTDLDDDDVFGSDWGDAAAIVTISKSM